MRKRWGTQRWWSDYIVVSSCGAIFETVTEITHPILHLYVTMLKMDVKGMNGWRTIVSTSNEGSRK